jgi:hypothetical protein
MGFVQKFDVNVVTATGGTAVVYTPPAMGSVVSIQYIADTVAAFASTADFTVASEDTGVQYWRQDNVTASAQRYPLAPANTATGAAFVYSGSHPVGVPYHIANERIKITIAQGGNTKAGRFVVLVA